MAARSALHRVGAATPGHLLRYGPPAADQGQLPCVCGQQAHYLEFRTKLVLSVLGPVPIQRPYYLCPSCHQGQFPVDRDLDVRNTELSPGVRRMMVLVGHEVPFSRARAQLKLLADLCVTTKAVERTAEAIGRDIWQRQLREIQRVKQLTLPSWSNHAFRFSTFRSTGPVCRWSSPRPWAGRGNNPANRRTPGKPNSAAASLNRPPMSMAARSEIQTPSVTSVPWIQTPRGRRVPVRPAALRVVHWDWRVAAPVVAWPWASSPSRSPTRPPDPSRPRPDDPCTRRPCAGDPAPVRPW